MTSTRGPSFLGSFPLVTLVSVVSVSPKKREWTKGWNPRESLNSLFRVDCYEGCLLCPIENTAYKLIYTLPSPTQLQLIRMNPAIMQEAITATMATPQWSKLLILPWWQQKNQQYWILPIHQSATPHCESSDVLVNLIASDHCLYNNKDFIIVFEFYNLILCICQFSFLLWLGRSTVLTAGIPYSKNHGNFFWRLQSHFHEILHHWKFPTL